jgi:hypothetical protein
VARRNLPTLGTVGVDAVGFGTEATAGFATKVLIGTSFNFLLVIIVYLFF